MFAMECDGWPEISFFKINSKAVLLAYLIIALSLLNYGCGVQEKDSAKKENAGNLMTLPLKSQKKIQKIMIAGSTSVQPIAEKLAEHYMALHPEAKIEVQGGGSSAGIQAAKTGAAEIGASSRELKQDEKELCEFILAYDAIVLIVNPKNKISNLSLDQAMKIFSGQSSDWAAVDTSECGHITCITREEGSGTRTAFEELIMRKKAEIADRCLVQDSTGALREIVADDPNAIGYVSFGGINDKVKPLSIDYVKPLMENFRQIDNSKKYKIIRPFLFVTRSKPEGLCLDFMNYIRSEEGIKILTREGLIPADDQKK